MKGTSLGGGWMHGVMNKRWGRATDLVRKWSPGAGGMGQEGWDRRAGKELAGAGGSWWGCWGLLGAAGGWCLGCDELLRETDHLVCH